MSSQWLHSRYCKVEEQKITEVTDCKLPQHKWFLFPLSSLWLSICISVCLSVCLPASHSSSPPELLKWLANFSQISWGIKTSALLRSGEFLESRHLAWSKRLHQHLGWKRDCRMGWIPDISRDYHGSSGRTCHTAGQKKIKYLDRNTNSCAELFNSYIFHISIPVSLLWSTPEIVTSPWLWQPVDPISTGFSRCLSLDSICCWSLSRTYGSWQK